MTREDNDDDEATVVNVPEPTRISTETVWSIACVQEIAGQTSGIRRAGSAALDLAYVAAGRFDAFWEMNLNEWDIAGGILLVKEAGGLISDFNGGADYLETGHIVCGAPKVFKPVLQIVQKNLGHLK